MHTSRSIYILRSDEYDGVMSHILLCLRNQIAHFGRTRSDEVLLFFNHCLPLSLPPPPPPGMHPLSARVQVIDAEECVNPCIDL